MNVPGMARAVWNLVVHFWAHTFRRAVKKEKPGEEVAKFREYYRDDNFVSLTAAEREELLNYQRCVVCGMCASVCPVYMPVPEAGSYRAPDSITAALTRSFPELGSARDAVYNCTQCGACANVCPRGVDIPALILFARRKTFEHSASLISDMYREKLDNLSRTGNVYGTQGTLFQSFRKSSAKAVFFSGCGARALLHDEMEKTMRLLAALGADVAVIDEICCGSFARSIGVPYDADTSKNADRIRALGADTVVAACPHCAFTMRKNPAFDGLKIVSPSEYIQGLPRHQILTKKKIAWHDPCFLGRRGGCFEAPRELIREVASDFVEMPRHGRDSICCGATEGEFIQDPRVSNAMAKRRAAQAAATGADILLTDCPACVLRLRGVPGALPTVSVGAFLFDLMEGRET